MKKTILMILAAAFMFASCEEEKNPPTADFTLSSDAAVQWDMVTITDASSGADETTYTVTGGDYVMDDASLTIQFLDAATYTVTQTATNADGTNESSMDVVVTEPDNTYTLEGTEYSIGTSDSPNAYWYDASAMGGTIYIRMLGDVMGQDNPNLLKLYPVAGPNPLQGTYTFSADGEIGTYDAGMTANYAGLAYDWTTSGETGGNLVIDLVYEDTADALNNVYDITLSSYTLSYGNWDFQTCFCFVPEGTKSFSLTYRGVIDPAN